MKKKLVSAVLVCAMLSAAAAPVFAAQSVDTLPYTDVSQSAAYYDDVRQLYRSGLMTGTASDRFSPDAPMTRAMLFQVLYNLAGAPEVTPVSLGDVPEGAWFARAVQWAWNSGMTPASMTRQQIAPNNLLTRQELAAVLYQYAASTGADCTVRGDLTSLAVQGQIEPWAQDAISWAYGTGLFTGGSLYPGETVARIDAAQAILALSRLETSSISKALNAILNDPDAPVSGYAVMAYQNGQPIFQRTGGYRFLDSENFLNNIPMDMDTRVRTASISKVFAAIGAMRLVEQGKLDLDKDISEYLGFEVRNPNYSDIPITCRMLMSHTSSLEDGTIYSIPPEYSIQEFFSPEGKYWLNGEHFANSDDGVDRSPGVYFHYCNLNFGVLGTIIECVSGQRFDEYMKANVLEPMGIGASYNPGDFDAEEIRKLSPIYQKQSGGQWDAAGPYVAQIDDYRGQVQDHDKVLITNPELQDEIILTSLEGYQLGTNATLFSPQGGLRISPNEMKTLIALFLNGGTVNGVQILKPESVDAMFTPQWNYDEARNNGNTYDGLMCSYGLAIQTMTGEFGDKFVSDRKIVLAGHFGEAYGLLAGVFMDRETGTVIYYMMNGMGASEEDNYGEYSGMYRWEEKFCTALLNNLFPDL